MTTTETPAAQLRAAAARLRELANGATPGTWAPSIVTVPPGVTHFADPAHDVAMVRSVTAKVALCSTPGDAEYMASMHPLVALAVADWLDAAAETAEYTEAQGAHIYPESHALKVARAYLGEAERTVRAQQGETDGPHDH